MTITTRNKNPLNDSKCARHRSTTKGGQKQLENVIAALKGQQDAKYRHFSGTPAAIRQSWNEKFGQGLPKFNSEPQTFKGSAGLGEWLGTGRLTADLAEIWKDFHKIFALRSDDKDTQEQTLFVSHTDTNFDLIYSKWGTKPDHKFFHWASTTNPEQKSRATIDDFDDADDAAGGENSM